MTAPAITEPSVARNRHDRRNLDETISSLQLDRPTPSPAQPAETISGSMQEKVRAAKIMIVDDEPYNVLVVRKFLQQGGYSQFISSTDSNKILDLLHRELPDVLLLDVMMPQVSGLDILRAMKMDSALAKIPVVVLTTSPEASIKTQALELGVSDFLSKPVDPSELMLRVRNVLTMKVQFDMMTNYSVKLESQVRDRTSELAESRRQVIYCLARACEFRDNDTGSHIIRVGKFAGIIARELGYSEAQVDSLELAAQLHDIGKIGLPDSILNKPGSLDPDEYAVVHKHCGIGKQIINCLATDEWSTVKQHTKLGARMLDAKASPVLALAARIALTHHEWWDGQGYPLGLSGTDIPIEGRITAVADVYDALSCKRVYKKAFSREKCFSILREGREKQFDPKVLDAFFRRSEQIIETQLRYADED